MSKSKTNPGEQALVAVARSAWQTLESIVVAFILAFVCRAFIVEAYRIPTGSMAPTLYGSHRSRMCYGCGYEYAYEVIDARPDIPGFQAKQPRVNLCPVCKSIDKPLALFYGRRALIENGDRILVMKLGFELADIFPQLEKRFGPRRWDIVVFKNPADPTINFIKRLVGLPGEKIEIIDGDVYVNDRIARKTRVAQQSLWFIVYDSDYLPKRKDGIDPEDLPGWIAKKGAGAEMWDTSGRVLVFRGRGRGESGTIEFNAPPVTYFSADTRPGIKDFYAYDDPESPQQHPSYLVSDLKLECMLVVREGVGSIEFALSKRDDVFLARINTEGELGLFRTKLGNLDRGDRAGQLLSSKRIPPMPLRTPVRISFENVDHCVRLAIDGKTVLGTTEEQYSADPEKIRQLGPEATPAVVQISAEGLDCQLWHTRLYRDIYYRWAQITERRNLLGQENRLHYGELGHGVAGNPIVLGSNDYYVLGDNSPASKDSRLWWEVGPHLRERYEAGEYKLGTVPRDQMVGKAIFVYWPAGLRMFRNGPGIIPNVGQMRFTR